MVTREFPFAESALFVLHERAGKGEGSNNSTKCGEGEKEMLQLARPFALERERERERAIVFAARGRKEEGCCRSGMDPFLDVFASLRIAAVHFNFFIQQKSGDLFNYVCVCL